MDLLGDFSMNGIPPPMHWASAMATGTDAAMQPEFDGPIIDHRVEVRDGSFLRGHFAQEEELLTSIMLESPREP